MTWTDEMQAWLDETLSRATPLKPEQLDTVRFAARRAAATESDRLPAAS